MYMKKIGINFKHDVVLSIFVYLLDGIGIVS